MQISSSRRITVADAQLTCPLSATFLSALELLLLEATFRRSVTVNAEPQEDQDLIKTSMVL